jgi:glycine cleavage system H protein
MSYPEDLLYTQEHEWLRVEGDVATVGITWHAQDALGDIVFAELPEVGAVLGTGDSAGELESVKAVSDVYSPIAGEIVEVNEALDGAEAALNTDPYGTGWMFKMRVGSADELDGLMNAEAYQAFIANAG